MGFKFAPTEKDIEINGATYTLKVGDIDTMEAFDRLRKETPATPAKDPTTDPTGIRGLCAQIGKQIDVALGPGAYAKIFAGRTVNLKDHMDLLGYITKEMRAFNEEHDKAMLGPVNPPRVRRDPDTGEEVVVQ